MSLSTLEAEARKANLSVFGDLSTVPADNLGEGVIVLLGPHEPGFWAHVTTQAEFSDGLANPLDRWSRRVVTSIAEKVGGTGLLPFGEPARPFIGWALRSGRAWSSPVGLLVHDVAGLMLSYRGAVFVPDGIGLETTSPSPCTTCAEKPCLGACPVGALTGDAYQLDTCHAFLDRSEGKDCMTTGCAVRRACPISRSYGRLPAQSAFHMRQFHHA